MPTVPRGRARRHALTPKTVPRVGPTGLTSRQAYALEHIVRCTCGSWMLVTDPELHELTAAGYVADPVCRHFSADEEHEDHQDHKDLENPGGAADDAAGRPESRAG